MKVSPRRTLKWWLILSFAFAICVSASYPLRAEQAGTEQAKKLDSIRAFRAGKIAAFKLAFPKVAVRTNPVTGGPEDLWGDLSKNQTKTEHQEAAYEFFEQNKELYGITSPREELKLQYRTNKMVDFKQLYRGVEIYRSSIRAYFTPEGRLKGIMGGFILSLDISTTPSIDSIPAIEIAKGDLKQGGKTVERMGGGSARLTIYPSEGKYNLVWIVNLMDTVDFWEDWQYNIDAKSGHIVRKGTRGVRDFRSGTPALDGKPDKDLQKRQTLPRRSPEDSKKEDSVKKMMVFITPLNF